MNDTDTLVWTGREVLALGTACAIGGNVEAPDLAYDPHTAGWRSLPVLSFDDRPRCGSDAFWTGSQVVVWGGSGGNGIVADNRVRVYTPPAAPVVTATTTTTASIAPTDPLDGLALESFAARVVVEEYLAASTPRPPSSS